MDKRAACLARWGRILRQELNDDIAERDRTATFPRDSWKRCAEFGMQSMPVPSAYNASGVDTDMLSGAIPHGGQRTSTTAGARLGLLYA
ncbi:MAG: acyl-CoA dehydrogenase family protein [Gemmatimonadales bacterium]